MKNVQLLDIGDYKIIPMCSGTDQSVPPNWEELDVECDVLEDRIRFKTTHFGYFSVIARFSPPTATVMVNPNVCDTVRQVQLTVPELPGFKVEIPPKSVQSATEVKATLHYDDSEVCNSDFNHPLASACVHLEPHGMQFSEKILVQIPIPGYSRITSANPNAIPQLLYSTTGLSSDWIMHNEMKIYNINDDYIAEFFTDHFSFWRINWSESVPEIIGSIFKRVRTLGARCQVFMTRETEVESTLNMNIQVLVYAFQESPIEIPTNYHYILHDSGRCPIQFSPGYLHFSLKLKDYLFSENDKKFGQNLSESFPFSENFPARVEFDIDLDKESRNRLKDGLALARLIIKGDEDSLAKHHCSLIKVCNYSNLADFH